MGHYVRTSECALKVSCTAPPALRSEKAGRSGASLSKGTAEATEGRSIVTFGRGAASPAARLAQECGSKKSTRSEPSGAEGLGSVVSGVVGEEEPYGSAEARWPHWGMGRRPRLGESPNPSVNSGNLALLSRADHPDLSTCIREHLCRIFTVQTDFPGAEVSYLLINWRPQPDSNRCCRRERA